MFTAIDVDGDGVITKAELRKAIVQLKKLDADGDGNLTLAEVSPRGGPGGPGEPGGPAWDPAQDVERLMENDKNADGKLSADEVTDTVKRMIDGADQNGDGIFDRAELTAHMDNMRNRFRGGPRGGGPRGGGPGGPGVGFRGPGGFGNQPFDPTQFTGQLMQNDRNRDGRLTADEVPQQAMGMLQGGDRNNDGAIDAAELQIIMRRMGGRARALGAGPNSGDEGGQGRGDTSRRRLRAREEN
jgi:Ca2+-binding EF-hand superfamily protein